MLPEEVWIFARCFPYCGAKTSSTVTISDCSTKPVSADCKETSARIFARTSATED